MSRLREWAQRAGERWDHPRISPDGLRYLVMADGDRVTRPFNDRWLIPWLAGSDPKRWRFISTASVVAVVGFTALWAGLREDSWLAAVVAGLVIVGCAGVVDVNLKLPVLVDAAAMTFALGSAILADGGVWWGAVAYALVAGASKETAPLFAALWALSPIPLVGLLAPLAARALRKPGPEIEPLRGQLAHRAVSKPFKTSILVEKGNWRRFDRWLGPWNAGLLGFLWPPAWPALVAGYGQCLFATDRVRLYQWAAPAVALGAATVVTDWRLVPLLALVAWWRPFPSDGL